MLADLLEILFPSEWSRRGKEAKPLWNSNNLAVPKDNVTSAKGVFIANALHQSFAAVTTLTSIIKNNPLLHPFLCFDTLRTLVIQAKYKRLH